MEKHEWLLSGTITSHDIATALRLLEPYSADSIIEKLAAAARILLQDKNYDGHGHEELQTALDLSEDLRSRLLDLHRKAIGL